MQFQKLRKARANGSLTWRDIPVEWVRQAACGEMLLHADIEVAERAAFLLASWWPLAADNSIAVTAAAQILRADDPRRAAAWAVVLASRAGAIEPSPADSFLELVTEASGYISLRTRRARSVALAEQREATIREKFSSYVLNWNEDAANCRLAYLSSEPHERIAAMTAGPVIFPGFDFSHDFARAFVASDNSPETLGGMASALHMNFFGAEEHTLVRTLLDQLHRNADAKRQSLFFKAVMYLAGVPVILHPSGTVADEDREWIRTIFPDQS
ncbi:MAG: hypothetical protein R3C49_00555 [Planctomycetaceae bacterium]